MNRFIKASIVAVIALLLSRSFSPGLASSEQHPALGAELNFAPGSIVRFEHMTSEDGLSQNAGLDIFQDSRGYLWIGTQDGLNRYDGYSFKIYKHDPDDDRSISHNSILNITEDMDGTLWIGTWGGGLNHYDPVTEQFTRYQHDPEDPGSISDNTVTSILKDSQGNLWVGTLNGLNRFDAGTFAFEHFKNDPSDPNSLSSNAISLIFEDSNQQLWIGTGANGMDGSGLNRFDPSTGTATRYQYSESDPESLSSNNIAAIYETGDGTFWIATGGFSLHGGGLEQFDPRTGKAKHFTHDANNPRSISSNDLTSLWGDETGMLWIGTYSQGLNRMDLSQPGIFSHYSNDPFFGDSLSGDEIWALFKDRSGILWIGTSHSGINKLPANNGQFSLYRNNPSDPTTLGINATGAFAEDKRGNIWIATWGAGLDRFNPGTGQFTHYRHDPDNPNSLSDDLFMDVYVDDYGLVWAGTLGKGLNRLDPAINKVTHYLHDPQDPTSIADDNIASVIPDKHGGIWVGSFGGLSYYDPNTDSFTNYSNDPAVKTSLSYNMVVSLFIDSTNNLWIGTWGGGLNQLDLNDPDHTDPKLASFTRYRNITDDPSSLSEDSVWAIHGSPDGKIWLGTQLGLNRFDPNTKTFEHYTEKQGLPNNVVLGILADDMGELWLTTNNGLAQFDPQTGKFTIYDSSDGLQSNEFNSNAYYRAGNGIMYIGGINGFNSFDPNNIKPNPIPPQVTITKFEVFNEPLAIDLSGSEPIQLSYEQDLISFEFAAFDFQAPNKNQYAYMLEGFDEDWIMAGNRHYATYTNLPGGEYIFRVKASNSDGIWDETGIAVPLVITPPVWQMGWFGGGLILVLGVLVAAGYRLRFTSIREQNIHLETQISERTSELRETNKLLEKEVEQRKRAESELARRAAEELQQSEARFQAAFESSAIGMGILTLDGRILQVNDAVMKMSGYTREELLERSDDQNVYPEDLLLGMDLFQELLEGKRQAWQVEKRYVRRSGEVFWTRLTLSIVRDLQGNPQYIIALIDDIDKEKKAVEQLRESEARFRAMFDTASVGITLIAPDRRVLAVNPAVVQMSGYTEAEMLAMTGQDITYHEDLDIGRDEFIDVLKGKRNAFTIEKRYVRQDGVIYWTRISLSAVRDMDGNLLYLVAITEDIDQQKRALEDLRESEARFRAMYDNVAVGMAMMSLDRRIISVNQVAAQMTGYSVDELAGMNPSTLSHPEDAQIGMEQFREMAAGRLPGLQMQKRFFRKDGNIFWGRVTYSVVPDKAGKPEYLVGLIEDVTEEVVTREKLAEQEADYLRTLQLRVQERTRELQEANEKLQREIEQRIRIEKELAEKAAVEAVTADRTRLARDLHDAVTQTLFSASLTAEVLPDLWEMDLDEARRSTEELRQLTRGALAEMRTLLLELRPATLTQTRLSDLIRQLCEAFIGRSRLPIKLSIEGECQLPPEVQVAIYRIAQESLNNVFKYARATQVDVNLLVTPTSVHFATCDNGIGFDMSTSKPTSLGMRIMRERADAIGAEFQITSAPGEGTCVEVTWNANPNMKLRVL